MISSLATPAEETLRIHAATAVTHRVDAAHPALATPGATAAPAAVADEPHRMVPAEGEKLSSGGEELSADPGSSGGVGSQARTAAASADAPGPVDWRLDHTAVRACHLEDLLHQLQRLSEEIDARSAKLHVDIATHERRERAFRLWAQQHAQEILAQQEQCRQQQAALQAQARRLAMTDGVIRV